ncbi:Mitochondrial basic amino acids transporter [Vanrija pseudolonga]|uniref:Mitochondrial basic amino acids transporter n=1 Tax=Vanrija pseudolonga TaxID=143232 RepID=A0AAF1BG83_9TREE|nr:Mitochondrial basic amino acids transporter [Vanrija pseudolonga]
MSNEASTDAGPPPHVDFAAGVLAGGVGLLVGQPFDVVKVRYQTPQYNGRYNSILGAFRSIVREEKIPGLFKGVMSPMLNGVIFSSYSFGMKIQHTPEGQEPTLWQIMLAGAGSGVAASLLTCPIELVKIQQQSLPPTQNPSAWQVTKDIVRQSGVRGLYRGMTATICRDLAYGPYFFTYEGLCRFFKWRKSPDGERHPLPHKHDTLIDEAEAELHSGLSWAELMTAGGAAGVAAWVATFPFDVIKTRMQDAVYSGPGVKAPSMWNVAVQSVQKEGWRVMFAGLWPTVVRAVPTNMVIFLTFEACVAAMT